MSSENPALSLGDCDTFDGSEDMCFASLKNPVYCLDSYNLVDGIGGRQRLCGDSKIERINFKQAVIPQDQSYMAKLDRVSASLP